MRIDSRRVCAREGERWNARIFDPFCVWSLSGRCFYARQLLPLNEGLSIVTIRCASFEVEKSCGVSPAFHPLASCSLRALPSSWGCRVNYLVARDSSCVFHRPALRTVIIELLRSEGMKSSRCVASSHHDSLLQLHGIGSCILIIIYSHYCYRCAAKHPLPSWAASSKHSVWPCFPIRARGRW